MLTKLLLLLCFSGITSIYAKTLTVSVHNIKQVSGNLMVGVFNDENGFPDVYYKGEKVQITDTVVVVTFTGLPDGKYAASAYQDINNHYCPVNPANRHLSNVYI